MKKSVLIVCILLMNISLYGYESEEKLEAVIIGKIAKYIMWKDTSVDDFTIATLDTKLYNLFKEIYEGKQIKGKNVYVQNITDISKLGNPNILYISKEHSKNLQTILKNTQSKNILTVSNIRGFTEKNGIVQINFIAQKPKLKINLDEANKENLKVRSSLLRIVDVVKGAE